MGQYIFFFFLEGVQRGILGSSEVYTLGNISCDKINNIVQWMHFLFTTCEITWLYLFFYPLLVSPMGTKENDFLCILVTFLPHGLTVLFIF